MKTFFLINVTNNRAVPFTDPHRAAIFMLAKSITEWKVAVPQDIESPEFSKLEEQIKTIMEQKDGTQRDT